MKILRPLFALLLVTSQTIVSAESVLVSKSWMTDCKQDVEGKTRCELINNKTSLTSERKLSVDRDDYNEFTLVLLSEERLEKGMSLPVEATIKIDNNQAISTTGVLSYRNERYAQFIANFSEIHEIIEQMQSGNYLSTDFSSFETNIKVMDKFSLSGFTRNLEKALSLDKRRTGSEATKSIRSKSFSHQSTDTKIVGQWLETWGDGTKITIYKEGKELVWLNKYSYGDEKSKKLYTENVNGVTRYYHNVEFYKDGEFFTIANNGDLQYWGQSGNFYDAKPYTKDFSIKSRQNDLKAAGEELLRDGLGKELPNDMFGTFGYQETLEGTNGRYWVAYLPKVDISFVSEKGSRKVIFVGQSRASAIRFMKENY